MDTKKQYQQLCETEGCNIPLFLQYWWMETVCQGKRWDVMLSRNSEGSIVGALPYLIGSKMGLRFVLQPQLTQYNGPWYRPGCDKGAVQIDLLRQLKKLRLALFLQNCAPGVEPLEGFISEPRPTYRIEDISDPEQVFLNFHKKHRQKPIIKAQQQLEAAELTPQEFARFHKAYWKSRGEEDLLSDDFMERIITASLQRGQGMLLGVKDTEGVLRAARFVAYDQNCAYALLSALNPEGHPNGASPLLFWLIIQHLSGKVKSFDFEGSMDPGIAYSYSLYGAQPATYYRMYRCPNPLLNLVLRSRLK